MIIRRLEDKDIEPLMHLVNITMRKINTETYPDELVEQWVDEQKEDHYRNEAKDSHVYVIEKDGNLIASGGISKPVDGVSTLKLVYVHPDHGGEGLGRKIMETVLEDEYVKDADKIVGSALINAIRFYKKLGFRTKDDEYIFNEDGTIEIEKDVSNE
ncbi:MAG TPA: GNAT family N-acetyltransferase [Candidatus Nosocomiicoccus stercorigallinarum]|nr:GNAT family N-acetyltransferase [Candidatus Nosocomiicoccus stercorigallinarum]